MAQGPTSEHLLVRQLESIATLSEAAKKALSDLPMHLVDVETDQGIVREGDRPTRCCLVLEGFVISFKHTGEGKRQILACHLPGDIPDLQSLHLSVLDSSLATVTPCKVGYIQHEALHDVCNRHPDAARAFWRWTLITAAIYREWVTNVGRRDAKTRMAHLLCETLVRMRAVGLAEDHGCELALTQHEFADATGITTVHVNRTLQALRRERLISLKGGTFKALDWEGLKRAGDFDPSYLHLRDASAFAT